MPSEYTVDNLLTDEQVLAIAREAMPHEEIQSVERVGLGSTNLIYRLITFSRPLILKISYRPDRIQNKVLAKEARVMRELFLRNPSISTPEVLWEGNTPEGHPAILMSHLSGVPIKSFLRSGVDTIDAFEQLGRFNAEFNTLRHHEIDEFEAERPTFKTFAECVSYWLPLWKPLLDQAEPRHVSQEQLTEAREIVHRNMPFFDDTDWTYVHGDLSAENVLGEVRDGKLYLTGVCDFESVQTGPAEYDLGGAWCNFFVYHPELEAPFMAGYTSHTELHPHWRERLAAASLYKALRYIKRSVKYKEVHYYDHDREFLEAWLNR